LQKLDRGADVRYRFGVLYRCALLGGTAASLICWLLHVKLSHSVLSSSGAADLTQCYELSRRSKPVFAIYREGRLEAM
jgi:hypothetical protein